MNPAIGVDLQITRLTGRGGALIGGVKLGPDLHPATVSAIRSALLEHKVIFFRDQQHLTDAAQEAFAKLLGELVPQPTIPSVDGTDVVLELDSAHGGRADSWHTDVTFVAAYPMASVLRGVVIPEAGGDTIWSNTEAAYANLPPAHARFADELRAIHTNQYRLCRPPARDRWRIPQALLRGIHFNGLRNRASCGARASRDRPPHARARSFPPALRRLSDP